MSPADVALQGDEFLKPIGLRNGVGVEEGDEFGVAADGSVVWSSGESANGEPHLQKSQTP